jgi:hypothetical protein
MKIKIYYENIYVEYLEIAYAVPISIYCINIKRYY